MPLFAGEVAKAVAHWRSAYPALTEALVHAVMERESGHGEAPNYRSHGGVVPEPGGHVSYGPMQIYDDTVKALGISFDPQGLASHPALGIWWGTKYLGGLLQRFKGDVRRAVAAYNAGPNRIGALPAGGPFPNQAYVDAVLRFWNQYRGGATSVVPLLALAGVIGWVMLRRQRRAA